MTPAQLATLKAAINADPVFSVMPNGPDDNDAIAKALNLPSDPVVLLWRNDVPVANIFDAIDFTKYTPTDAPDNTTSMLTRSINLQIKQINLQLMLQGRDRLNANKTNVRTALRDAVIQLPSGAAGAVTSSGGASGVTVLTACTRAALRIEAILSGASAQTGTVTAFLLGYEGTIDYLGVTAARNS